MSPIMLAPAPEPQPSWWPTLTAAQKRTLRGWLRVRNIDTTTWK